MKNIETKMCIKDRIGCYTTLSVDIDKKLILHLQYFAIFAHNQCNLSRSRKEETRNVHHHKSLYSTCVKLNHEEPCRILFSIRKEETSRGENHKINRLLSRCKLDKKVEFKIRS